MAERIQGLTIGLDLDSVGLERSLSEVKRSFKGLNSSIKTNSNNLKYGEKSIENYESNISALTTDIQKQRKNVDDLNRKYKEEVAQHGENSRSAQNLAVEYNRQADNLNYLERQLENAKKEYAEFQRQQEIQSSGLYKTGTRLTNFGDKLQVISGKTKEVGKSLTKWITTPAVGVASAATGITAAFGWDRLTGLDSAQAQLKGLGYNTEEVGKITDHVTNAIDGGMTTMAEGTQVAAGAMAAGVEEGEDLERYIKLVGDAAVGANRPVGDMAQIFNRVQGQGKLMTQELNMIEQGMPGFSQAMAKHLNVSQEEFREMVTAGEVSSEEFLDVMEDFAGGMAEAYADSWQGMVANTKAYIGQIGEKLLGGVFDKSKESLSQFIDILSSDAAAAWAEETGKKIGDMFNNLVDKVKVAITWFMGLNSTQKKLIGSLGAVVVAAGPLLVALGTLGGVIGRISSGLGTFGINAANAGGLLRYLRVGFMSLTGPVGLTVAAIAGLATGLVLAYQKSETFRNVVNKIKDAFLNAVSGIKEFLTTNPQVLAFVDGVKKAFQTMKTLVSQAIHAVVSFFKNKIAEMKAFWDENGQQLLQAFKNVFNMIKAVVSPVLSFLVSIFKKTFPILKTILGGAFKAMLSIVKSVWNNIKGVIDGGLQVIQGLIKTFSGLFTGDFKKMWSGIKDIFSGAIKFIWNFVQLQFFGRMLKIVKPFASSFKGIFSTLWNGIKTIFSTVIKWIVDFVKNRFTTMKNVLTSITNAISNIITKIWNSIWAFFKKIIKSIVDFVKNRFTGMKNTTTNIFNGIKTMAGKVWNGIKKVTVDPIKSLVSTAKQRFGSFKDKVAEIFGNIKDGISEKVTGMVEIVKGLPGRLKEGVVNGAGKVKDGFLYVASRMVDGIFSGVNGIIDGVNWAWNKLGGKENKFKHLKPTAGWYVSEHAKGTDSHPGGLAKVNDGKGSNAGPELIRTPDGTTGMFKGKNVYANLPAGTQVLSAKETKQIPAYKFGTKAISDAWNATKDKIKSGAKWTGEKAKAAGRKVKDGTMWLGKKAKDGAKAVLNTALKALGIKTPPKRNDAKGLIRRSFLNVKDAGLKWLKEKIKIKQEEHEGGGINPFGKGFTMTSPYGMRNGKMHHGVDYAAAMGTPVKSATSGTVKQAGWGKPGSGYGNYGNVVSIMSGAREFLYTHLSKVLAKSGKNVKAGDVIGNIGSTGDSTGPHTHFEIRKNGQLGNTIDPKKFFASQGSPGGSGVERWRPTVIKALKANGLSTSKAMQDKVLRQIKTESGGNEKAIQKVWDVNMANGTPARGLMQTIPSTFNAFKHKGHGNILKGYDNLLAALAYAKSRYGKNLSALGKGHGYQTGGLINKSGLYNLAEGGYPEFVIPTDPRRRTDAMKLLALAGKQIQGNKRPGQLPNVGGGSDSDKIAEKLDQLIELLSRNSGQEFHFHNNGPSSPADNARKIKQVNQQLGMGLR